MIDSDYGLSLFETICIRNSKAEFLKEHLNRLIKSANSLNFLNVPTFKNIETLVFNRLELLDAFDGSLKIILWYSGKIDLSIGNKIYTNNDFEKGFDVTISKFKRNENSMLCNFKTGNYMENFLSLKIASSNNFDEVLFLNSLENISEGAKSNVFFTKDNNIFTPSVKSGILPGIMRDYVIKILFKSNFKLIEGTFSLNDILDADEVFLTNSLMRIMPVNKLDFKSFKQKSISRYLKSITEMEGLKWI